MKGILVGLGFGLGWAGMTGSGIEQPQRGSVIIVCAIAVVLGWFLGRRRGLAMANASANASAVAAAAATSEALAQSTSSAQGGQVNLQVVLPGQAAPVTVERFTPAHRVQVPQVVGQPDQVALTREAELAALAPDRDLGEVYDMLNSGLTEEELLDELESGTRP